MGEPQTTVDWAPLPDLDAESFAMLRDDIAVRGVAVPIEVDENGDILDGHARFAICQELGIKDYPRVVRVGMTPEEKVAHRIVLNLARRHLTRDQKRAVAGHLRQQGWSLRRIGTAMNTSKSQTQRLVNSGVPNGTPDRVVGKDGKAYPARRMTSTVVSSARDQKMATSALIQLGENAPKNVVPIHRATRLAREARRAQAPRDESGRLPSNVELFECSISDLPVDAGSVDVVLTDPPYTRDLMSCYSELGECAARWLKPNGTLLAMCGQMFLPEALERLSEHLEYRWLVASVFEHGHGAIHSRRITNGWRPILVFHRKGHSPTKSAMLADVGRSAPSSKDLHAWQQSVSESAALLRAAAPAGGLIVDPFVGSGTVAAAAVECGMDFIGGDSDPDAVAIARSRLAGSPS